MSLGTITSASAVFTITVLGVFLAPQALQGFSTDDIFSTERLQSVAVEMGVDGEMAAGFMFVPLRQTVILQANSESNDVFDQWWMFMQTAIDAFPAAGIISLPAIKKKFIMVNGSLTGYQPIPNAAKTLRPREYEITWKQMIPSPI